MVLLHVLARGGGNHDGTVNAADYPIWRDNRGAPDETALNNNGDGLNGVDQADYVLWKNNYGAAAGAGGGAAVPEPSAALLLVGLALCITGARRCAATQRTV